MPSICGNHLVVRFKSRGRCNGNSFLAGTEMNRSQDLRRRRLAQVERPLLHRPYLDHSPQAVEQEVTAGRGEFFAGPCLRSSVRHLNYPLQNRD